MGALRSWIFNIAIFLATVSLAPAYRYLPGYYFWCYALVLFAAMGFLFAACTNLSWGFFIKALCKAKTNERVVALSFDDGPATYTQTILNTLKEHSVEATFFCVGKNIAGKEQVISRIVEEGHTIGNHSYSHHFWFDMWGVSKMMSDMQEMDKEVMRVTGLKPVLFRPPYGVINPNLAAAIKTTRYTTIGWSVRSFDTKIKDEQMLLSRITVGLKPGDIILLHDSMAIT